MDADYYALLEEHAEDLVKPSADQPPFPRAWATLSINVSLLSPEDREKLYQAVDLLRDIGFTCDTGMGCGGFDLELDWSVSGAVLKVRAIRCLECNKPNLTHAYWAVYAHTGRTNAYAFCSPACRQAHHARASRWTVVFEADSDVGLEGWTPPPAHATV